MLDALTGLIHGTNNRRDAGTAVTTRCGIYVLPSERGIVLGPGWTREEAALTPSQLPLCPTCWFHPGAEPEVPPKVRTPLELASLLAAVANLQVARIERDRAKAAVLDWAEKEQAAHRGPMYTEAPGWVAYTQAEATFSAAVDVLAPREGG